MGERWAGKRREFQWPLIMETTALGSVYAAGLAVGFYKDLEELRDQLGSTRGSRRWRASCANVYIGNGRRQ
jgi:glycerol kinase